MRNGSVTPRKEGFTKKTKVMLLEGCSAVDVKAEAYPVSIKLESLLRRYFRKKGASNLQSNFLFSLDDECTFSDLLVHALVELVHVPCGSPQKMN